MRDNQPFRWITRQMKNMPDTSPWSLWSCRRKHRLLWWCTFTCDSDL